MILVQMCFWKNNRFRKKRMTFFIIKTNYLLDTHRGYYLDIEECITRVFYGPIVNTSMFWKYFQTNADYRLYQKTQRKISKKNTTLYQYIRASMLGQNCLNWRRKWDDVVWILSVQWRWLYNVSNNVGVRFKTSKVDITILFLKVLQHF